MKLKIIHIKQFLMLSEVQVLFLILIGKEVTYNDILKFNYQFSKALIENNDMKLSNESVNFILNPHDDIEYKTIIQDNFKDTYFTDDENKWLDMVITNMNYLDNEFEYAIAFFALSQSCIIKRPYNLFHYKFSLFHIFSYIFLNSLFFDYFLFFVRMFFVVI